MSTPRRAAEILNHYFKLAFEAQGITWGPENQRDIIDLVKGLTSTSSRPSVPPAPPASAPRSTPRPTTTSAAHHWLDEEV